MKVYIYCTKAKPDIGLNGKVVACFDLNKVEEINCCFVPYSRKNNLGYELFIDNGVYHNEDDKEWEKQYNELSGLVFERKDRYIDTMLKNEDLKKMCLTPMEVYRYLKDKEGKGCGRFFYNWHIENLKIFDEPMELSEFNKVIDVKVALKKGIITECEITPPLSDEDEEVKFVVHNLNKAPQSWYYIENENEENCILISIKPQQVEKIINGEQTIIIRKTAPKELR